MPLNIPAGTRSDISFGPAVLYAGAAGYTPTTDIGFISEDGMTVEITSEMRTITQGNPKNDEMRFIQSQSVTLTITSIEWNFDNLVYALGAGNTDAGTTFESFAFGGGPCSPSEIALLAVHQMCQSGNTVNLYVWRAMGEGTVTIPFTHDEHKFELKFRALRSDLDWAGNTLAADEQLILILREI